jgi:hypothetical protein
MDNPKKPESSKTPNVKSSIPPAKPPVWRKFEDALYNYTQAIREAQLDANQGVEEAHRRYLQVQQEIQADAQSRSWVLYVAYGKAIQEASRANDSKAAEAARREYEQALEQVHADTQKRVLEAHDSYVQTLSSVTAETKIQEAVEAAYRNYLKDLQQVWAEVDVTAIDPGILGAISHGVATAALSACGSLGRSRPASK